MSETHQDTLQALRAVPGTESMTDAFLLQLADAAMDAPPKPQQVEFPFVQLRFIMRVLGYKGSAPKEDWATAHEMARNVYMWWLTDHLKKSDEIDEEEASMTWRRLAMQFDQHRMTALGWLRRCALNMGTFAIYDDIQKFLAAAPQDGNEVLAERIKAIVADQKPFAYYGYDVDSVGTFYVSEEAASMCMATSVQPVYLHAPLKTAVPPTKVFPGTEITKDEWNDKRQHYEAQIMINAGFLMAHTGADSADFKQDDLRIKITAEGPSGMSQRPDHIQH